jgi:signal transduction histidine kinase
LNTDRQETLKYTPAGCNLGFIPSAGAGSDEMADVSNQPGQAEALLKTGALQRAIFNSANFSSIATDAKGTIQIFNVGAERMLGYAAAEVVNRLTAADLHDPQELIQRAAGLTVEFGAPIAAGFDALVFKAARGIEDIYELTKIRKDGSRFPAILSVTALRDPNDAIIGYLLIGTDNTARHEAEQARKALDQRLRDVEQTLQQTKILHARDAAHAKELALVNQELEAFSYSVSHDLRAPLRHIHGYVEMLRTATAGQLSDKVTRYLQTITDASVEMGDLIDDLLAFSRVGRAEMQGAAVDLGQLVADVVRGLEMAINDRPIAWTVAPLPRVLGDASLLKQVLTNLLDNAIKYTRTRAATRIEIGCAAEENGRAVLFVRDNGVGFDMQYADKLFGVFQRLHRAEEFEGTGIGLATVRRIVGRHGGRVWADGALNEGATFYFTLELAPV